MARPVSWNRMVGAWCRGLVGILVVVAAADIELFDELHAGKDAVYQSDNDINSDMLFPHKMASRNSPELSSNRLEEGDERPAHHDPSDGLMMKNHHPYFASRNAQEKVWDPAKVCFFKSCSIGSWVDNSTSTPS